MQSKKTYTSLDMIKAASGAVLAIGAICGIGYAVMQKWDLTFESKEEKIRNQIHLKNIGTEADFAIEKERNIRFQEAMYQYIEQDKKDTKDLKKHVHGTDSVLRIEAELNRKNADQIFQINQKTNQ